MSPWHNRNILCVHRAARCSHRALQRITRCAAKRGDFEKVPQLTGTTVAGNRLARRWAAAAPCEIGKWCVGWGTLTPPPGTPTPGRAHGPCPTKCCVIALDGQSRPPLQYPSPHSVLRSRLKCGVIVHGKDVRIMLLKKYTVGCFRPASAWRPGYCPDAGRNASPVPGACKGCRSCWRTPGDAVSLGN